MMLNIKKILITFMAVLAGIFFITPSYAGAQVSDLTSGFKGPIVFCGTKASPTPCGVCDIFKLVKNLLDFAFFQLVPLIATIAIVYAGFLLLFSASPFGLGSVKEAQNIFKSVLIGLITAYSAWIIVNTLVMFFAGDINGAKEWYKFSCKVDSVGVINASGTLGGGSNNTGNQNTGSQNDGDKWCKQKGTSSSQSSAVSDSNKAIILKDYQPVNSLVSGYLCSSSPFGSGKCAMSKQASDRLANLLKTTKDLCSQKSYNCSIAVTSALRDAAAQDPCHKVGSSQAGTCADLQIRCSGGDSNELKCLGLLRQAISQSQAVDALNEYINTIPQGCPVPSTRQGDNVHVNF